MLALGLEAAGPLRSCAAVDFHGRRRAVCKRWWLALDLAPAAKRRLIKDFNHKLSLAQDIDRLASDAGAAATRISRRSRCPCGLRSPGRHALVTDSAFHRRISTVGGRSVGEIADRFLEQAALGAGRSLPRDVRALDRPVSGGERRSRRGAAQLRTFARDAGIGLDARPGFESL